MARFSPICLIIKVRILFLNGVQYFISNKKLRGTCKCEQLSDVHETIIRY